MGPTAFGGKSPVGPTASGGTTSPVVPSTGGMTSTDTTPSKTTPKFVGNITTDGGQVDVGNLKYKDYWNQVSPQNEGKWGSVSRAKGDYNWSSLDTLYKYAKANNIIFKQHTFVGALSNPTSVFPRLTSKTG